MALTSQDRKVAELIDVISQDSRTGAIVNLWETYDTQRNGKKAEWQELRNYIFATDTSTTTNESLPWKNSTTLPKLCQIRDNLHSNYLSALFPNDDWLKWMAYSQDAAQHSKANTIESYMKNKTREGGLRTEMSKLLYDFIDYGNAFATCDFVAEYKDLDGEKIPGYIGPKAYRISPLDIVFNPLASSFVDTWKIIRSVKTVGEVKRLSQTKPEYAALGAAIERRQSIAKALSGYNQSDFEKADAYTVDGYGNLQEYYQSGYVEFLEFYGDLHDPETGELKTNVVITIMDRREVVREGEIPSWLGHAPIYHAGWRFRPDNLWAMGPLDNLVGLQYRIDHLENLKADAMDLCVHPPLKIIGEVEEFAWGPGAEIQIDENGDVQELGKNLNGVIAAANEIAAIESRMELYAGAPREAMGIRSPGEKTKYEVQRLENAASRIFQAKIDQFEDDILEPLLNSMLELARRNMQNETIRVLNTEFSITEFMPLTPDDITGNGTLKPVGAKHFAEKAQLIQNLNSFFASAVGADEEVKSHFSSKKIAEMMEELLDVEKYDLVMSNVRLAERAEAQLQAASLQEKIGDVIVTPSNIKEGDEDI